MIVSGRFKDEIKRFNAEIEKYGKDGIKMMHQSVKLACQPILQELKAAAPVKSGATQRSLGIQQKKTSITLGIRRGDFGTESSVPPIVYAKIVEQKKPWFRNIWNKKEQRIDKDIRNNMSKAVQKVTKSIQKKLKKNA